MHYWGDEWFENNGDDLYNAINEIEQYLRKHHIGICGKEKYGTYRDEYLTFWDGGLYEILFGYRAYCGTFRKYKNKKIENFVNKIHNFIRYKIDYGIPNTDNCKTFKESAEVYNKRKWRGLVDFNSKIGLTKFVQKIQAKHYNYAFQLACKRYPHVVDELISMVDGYEMIKPCKYGNVDGTKIHNKYWKKI